MRNEDWLSDMDSNHDKSLQRALCYHYTIGHAARESSLAARRSSNNLSFTLESMGATWHPHQTTG